jgi:lipoprotein-anchoring transpeptidase ErfK/SrfK
MKALIIATLAMGTGLFLAALLWPDHAQPNPKQQRRSVTPPYTALPPSFPPATPPTPAASRVRPSSAYEAPSRFSMSYQSAPAPIPDQPADAELTDEQRTLKETGTDNTSLRNSDFPRTYISKIHVDLTGPNQWVTLTWSGPNARLQPTTRYHSSPGRGVGNNNCNDDAESHRRDSNCTPKGTMHVEAFSNSMVTSPECRYVTWFDTKRGIALHYYPLVPNYPASHGCVRLDQYAAQLIHNNSKIGETEVIVDGKWTFAR